MSNTRSCLKNWKRWQANRNISPVPFKGTGLLFVLPDKPETKKGKREEKMREGRNESRREREISADLEK